MAIMDNLNPQYIGPKLLSHPKVKEKTLSIGGAWRLEEITSESHRARYVRFHAILVNDRDPLGVLHVEAEINNEGGSLSGIEFHPI